jgi:peptidoglycan/xylan/chitin deacetylase (PgdA/CDA1 family)
MATERAILLGFDLEEFDMPLEYNCNISFEEQLSVTNSGMDILMPVLDFHKVATTFFTTANYALHNQEQVRQLSIDHEIASHTFYHSAFEEEHLLSSRLALEEIISRPVEGLRMPRMRQTSLVAIKDAGYLYDSSLNPTWLPGRYNYLNKPRTLHKENNLIRLPASVTPTLRLPLFWLMFKNMPLWMYTKLARQTLANDKYLCLYFHPWEFADLSAFKMPGYTKKVDGNKLADRLSKLMEALKTEASFIETSAFIKENLC